MIQSESDRYCYRMLPYAMHINGPSASECFDEVKPRKMTDEIVEGIVLPLIGLVGVLGNILGICHFGKKRQKTYYALMLALSMSDLVLIISFTLYYSLEFMFDFNSININLLTSSALVCCKLVSYPILYLSQTTGIYLTISLCIERYHAICRPLSYQIRKRSRKTYIVPVLSIAFIYNLPIFFEFSGIGTGSYKKWASNNITLTAVGNATLYFREEAWFRSDPVYQQIYHTGLKLIFKCIIPYISLIIPNVCIIRTLYGARYETDDSNENETRNKENGSSTSNGRQRKLTVFSNRPESDPLYVHISHRQQYLRKSQIDLAIVNMIIAVVFLISYSLIWAWAIHDFLHYMSSESSAFLNNPPWLQVSQHIFKILVVFNSSVNYYIYLLKRFILSPNKTFECCKSKERLRNNERIQLQTITENETLETQLAN